MESFRATTWSVDWEKGGKHILAKECWHADEWEDCYLQHNQTNNVKMHFFLTARREKKEKFFFWLTFALVF